MRKGERNEIEREIGGQCDRGRWRLIGSQRDRGGTGRERAVRCRQKLRWTGGSKGEQRGAKGSKGEGTRGREQVRGSSDGGIDSEQRGGNKGERASKGEQARFSGIDNRRFERVGGKKFLRSAKNFFLLVFFFFISFSTLLANNFRGKK